MLRELMFHAMKHKTKQIIRHITYLKRTMVLLQCSKILLMHNGNYMYSML